jgi:hypothetical protein
MESTSSENIPPTGGLNFIEQLTALSAESCSAMNRPFLTGSEERTRKALLLRPRCKQWNCAACAAWRAKLWIARIINGMNKADTADWRMLTITARGNRRGGLSLIDLRLAWSKLRKRLARHKNARKLFMFCRVFEQHKEGSWHMHVLVSFAVSRKWLKNASYQCGAGFMAHVTATIGNAGQAAGYLAKYTLKNAATARAGIEWPKGAHRIDVSENWPKLADLRDSSIAWIINQTREGQLRTAQYLYTRGFEIKDLVRDEK